MTAQARITQADMERVFKAAEKRHARVIMRLATGEIEVIFGDETATTAANVNEWDDE